MLQPSRRALRCSSTNSTVMSSPLPQTHQIDEVGNGLGVIHGGTAGDDQRRQAGALCAVDGDARQIQHIQNGGKGHLIAHGEGHDVKVRDRLSGLQSKQGHPGPAHLLFHVAPRGKDPLAPHAVHVVHDAVEDPHSQIGHPPKRSGRRKGNGDPPPPGPLLHRVTFPHHIKGEPPRRTKQYTLSRYISCILWFNILFYPVYPPFGKLYFP